MTGKLSLPLGRVTQSEEWRPYKPQVTGSSPVPPTRLQAATLSGEGFIPMRRGGSDYSTPPRRCAVLDSCSSPSGPALRGTVNAGSNPVTSNVRACFSESGMNGFESRLVQMLELARCIATCEWRRFATPGSQQLFPGVRGRGLRGASELQDGVHIRLEDDSAIAGRCTERLPGISTSASRSHRTHLLCAALELRQGGTP